MASSTPQRIIEALGLEPHPMEGGYFVESYRSADSISAEALPDRYSGARTLGTAIYFLLTHDTFSEMHRLPSDEVFHHYMGDPVEMLQLKPDGSGELVLLGNDFVHGQRPQAVVPGGVWQGSKLLLPHGYALLGCTVAPGFEFEDYERGSRKELALQYPGFTEKIEALTHE